MLYRKKKIEKLYYTIGEIADELGIATSVLRFWETEFGQLYCKKGRNGNRKYTKENFDYIRRIHYLLKVEGYTVWGAKAKLEKEDE